MEYRRLGQSGLKVSALSFGSWVTFGDQIDADVARDCMKVAFDAGVNFFDTADAYSLGRSEEVTAIVPVLGLAQLPVDFVELQTFHLERRRQWGRGGVRAESVRFWSYRGGATRWHAGIGCLCSCAGLDLRWLRYTVACAASRVCLRFLLLLKVLLDHVNPMASGMAA